MMRGNVGVICCRNGGSAVKLMEPPFHLINDSARWGLCPNVFDYVDLKMQALGTFVTLHSAICALKGGRHRLAVMSPLLSLHSVDLLKIGIAGCCASAGGSAGRSVREGLVTWVTIQDVMGWGHCALIGECQVIAG